MSEYSDIVKWHPHLILISEKPITWYGFLSVNSDIRIEVKLCVPNYPELTDASLEFGEQICLVQGTNFKNKVKELLLSANTVLSFLRQLQGLMEASIRQKSNDSVSKKCFLNNHMLEELAIVLEDTDIDVQGNSDSSLIKITYNSITIVVKPENTGNTSWTLVSSELPELSEWQPLEKCISTLMEATKSLKSRVDALEDTWNELSSIDENCWVIDPVDPKPCHLYRRIYINASLSLLIKVNPLDSEVYPEIKLLGSDREVLKCTEIMHENLNNWDTERTIPENIMILLAIDKLPRRPVHQSTDEDAIVKDEECCICFLMDSEHGELPTEICNNEKCRKHFHASCLLQWLQTIAGKQMCFDRCHGTCPVCKENISCAIRIY